MGQGETALMGAAFLGRKNVVECIFSQIGDVNKVYNLLQQKDDKGTISLAYQ